MFLQGQSVETTNVLRVRDKEQLLELLTKNTCIDADNNCNCGYVPYNSFDFDLTNPFKGNPYTSSEKDSAVKRFSDKCFEDLKEIRQKKNVVIQVMKKGQENIRPLVKDHALTNLKE